MTVLTEMAKIKKEYVMDLDEEVAEHLQQAEQEVFFSLVYKLLIYSICKFRKVFTGPGIQCKG